MAKRRANGEGNIRKRKDGRWEGRYTAGYDPETGKRIIKNVLGKTQAEVKEKLKLAVEDNRKVDVAKGQDLTVGQWAVVLPSLMACRLPQIILADIDSLSAWAKAPIMVMSISLSDSSVLMFSFSNLV